MRFGGTQIHVDPGPGALVRALSAVPACAPGDESETQMCPKGTKIALSITAAMNRFKALAQHPNKVYEVVIKPEIGRPKKKQALWLYPTVGVVQQHKRLDTGSTQNQIVEGLPE